MPNTTPNETHLWDQYMISIDNYKFHIETAIKINTFHYAITGAILSFYFTHSNIALAKWSLFLPLTFSLGLAYLSLSSLKNVEILRNSISSIAVHFKFKTFTEVRVLYKLLFIFSILHIITAIMITFTFFLAPEPSSLTTVPPKENMKQSFFNASGFAYTPIYQINSTYLITYRTKETFISS